MEISTSPLGQVIHCPKGYFFSPASTKPTALLNTQKLLSSSSAYRRRNTTRFRKPSLFQKAGQPYPRSTRLKSCSIR